MSDDVMVAESSREAGGRAAVSAGTPAIQLEGVSKQFAASNDNVQAVEHVDLSIDQGEFFSLLGPSGCGKTTTLRMVAGFEDPTTGQILLYGSDVVGVPPNRRDVNLVFQNYALFPHMSVFENIAFGLRRKKMERSKIDARVGEMLELVELTGRDKRRPRELSGGQQQRVALARALVNRPRALLLDEPLGALDLKLRQAMQLELKRIQREVGITFVYVTHDQGEALTMSDRLVVMNAGRVEQLGTPREVYEQPRTRFVAGFIGTSNLLTGAVTRVVDGSAVLERGVDQRIVVPLRGRQTTGDVVLTVRPEKILMSSAEPTAQCRLSGVVREVVYQGTFTGYTVETDAGEPIVVHVQNSAGSLEGANAEDTVWLSWDADHSYLLDETADPSVDNSVPAASPGDAAVPLRKKAS
ncbi:MAG: ABC transporter ATP-binding protein [Nocardioidaceae bacterium]